MTPTEAIRGRMKWDFGSWWFIHGGSIHGLWKRKDYSAIRDLAMSLPREASKHEHEKLLPIIDGLLAVVEMQRDALAKIRFNRGTNMGNVNADNYNVAAQCNFDVQATLEKIGKG